jgi:hypothetical protein
MNYYEEKMKALDGVKRHSRRRMAAIRRLLLPEVRSSLSAVELAGQVGRQLAELPPAERRLLKKKVALAISDLSDLEAMLSQCFTAVRGELQRIHRLRKATMAYGRMSTTAPRRVRQSRRTRLH